jgi:transcriptional regulator with XRE-family HTH domain
LPWGKPRPASTETLPDRLRYARKCRRLTIKVLAKYTGLPPSSIEGWEQGKPIRHDRLRMMAYYLEVPILWLVTGEGEVPCRPLTEGERMMARADISPETRLHQLRAAGARLPEL